jgi:hypothetical protein
MIQTATFYFYMSRQKYGLSFIDGEKLHRMSEPTLTHGGMAASSSTAVTKLKSTPKSSSDEMPKYHENKSIMSQQKLGASKIVIPGDVSKPLLFKRLKSYINRELQVLGATQ